MAKLREKQMTALREIYYDPETATDSVASLRAVAKEAGLQVTVKEATQFLNEQTSYQITKDFKTKAKLFSSIIAPRPGSNLQIDFMFLKKPYNIPGFSGALLNVVDIHSRRAWSFPLKSRAASLYVPELRKLFNSINAHGEAKRREQLEAAGIKPTTANLRTVQSINSDNEFIAEPFVRLLADLGITQYKSEVLDFAKNAIVERFNRTLRKLMKSDKPRRPNGVFTKDDILRYTRIYNKRPHSTIKAKPIDVYEYRAVNNQKYRFVNYNIQVGDKVRTLNKNALFEKGTYAWSPRVYTVLRKEKKRYYLNDDNAQKASYLGYELQVVNRAEDPPGYTVVDNSTEKDRVVDYKLQEEAVRSRSTLVGKTIEVRYTDGEPSATGQWYKGKVASLAKNGYHSVHFQDGTKLKLNLTGKRGQRSALKRGDLWRLV